MSLMWGIYLWMVSQEFYCDLMGVVNNDVYVWSVQYVIAHYLAK